MKNAAGAIEFYQRAFGATELFRLSGPSGKIGHAEIKTGEAVPMLSVEYPEMNVLSPETIGGSPVGIHLYVEDVDAAVKNDPSVRRRGVLRRQDNNVRAWAKAVRGTELPVIDSGAAVPVPLNDAILQRHFAAQAFDALYHGIRGIAKSENAFFYRPDGDVRHGAHSQMAHFRMMNHPRGIPSGTQYYFR